MTSTCTRFVGDIFDPDTVRAAMDGCDVVYYCVVDTRAWLRDPAPLFHTNVEGLRGVLEIAVRWRAAGSLKKFVFTSSYSTVGRKKGRVATEDDPIDPRKLTAYVRSRVQAEDLVMQYARDHGLPAVAMCVSSTYGRGDYGMTPHGALIAGTAFGKLPFVFDKISLEAVGVEDAARALILAADRGRVGERYLISERMISNREVVRIAADEVGVPVPRRTVSVPAALRDGRARVRQSAPARQRRTSHDPVGPADAGRGRGRLQQGQARTGLATPSGAGIRTRSRQILGATCVRRGGRPNRRGEFRELIGAVDRVYPMSRIGLLFGAALTIAATVTACGSSSTTATSTACSAEAATSASVEATAPAAAPAATITIENFMFNTPESVPAGATIAVKNSDPAEHSVTADSGNTFNVEVDGGETKTFTAPSQPGSYPYHCSYHPMMHGTLVVK